ncbi:MAG: F0F1 ATP synthase subunit delta, partial [Oscillospiraceae bacterium]|nr:F0F1 ATP synthase subunit delta [Oscillospiraceae bacterium]
MLILYMTINFLLLAAALWYFGRKTVRGIFEKRRSEINLSLDEAEECLRPLPPPEEDPQDPAEDAGLAGLMMKLKEEQRRTEAKSDEQRAALENELEVMRSNMLIGARDDAMRLFADKASRILSSEPFASRFRQKESAIADRILERVKVTAGDRVYIMHHDVLYVTLRSAFELEEGLVERIRGVAEDMVKKAGGEISFRVLVDPELTGGLLLRVGDKVFDGTIRNILLHTLRNELNANSAELLKNGGDIASCLEKAIERVSVDIDEYQLGRAISVSDGICWMDGLADSMFGELVEFENGELGMIMDIEPSRVGCMVFGSCKHIQEYSRVRRLGWMADVPVGEELLGRVVDPLGKPLDGRGAILAKQTLPVENTAPAILDSQPVSTPLYTGIKAEDALIPIG